MYILAFVAAHSAFPVLKMKQDKRSVVSLGFILVLFTCFALPSLLFKSFRQSFRETNDLGVGFSRARRSVEHQGNQSRMKEMEAPPQNCVKPSIDEFPNDFMTQYERQKRGGVLFHSLLAMYMFGALALICNEYFVPSLEKITNKLHMNSDVAGATFMAAGSSAPELFTSIIGVFITKRDIGLGTIVGSAVFNILFIVGVCGLFGGSTLHLSRWPLLRDSLCYLLSIAALIGISYDRTVYWYEALVLVCMYLMYVIIMYFNQTLEGFFEKQTGCQEGRSDVERNSAETEERISLRKEGDKDGVIEDDQEVGFVEQNDDSPFAVPQGLFSRMLWFLSLPLICLFYVTIPDCRKDKWERWFFISFCLSVFWIAILSYVLVWMVSIIGFTLGIPDVIMGLTFLAAGSSVPDGISSLIVARQGDADMAVSNTIGSNVFDILLCLGLPWFLKTTTVDLGGYISVLSGSIMYTSMTLFGTVFVTMICVVLNKWRLNKCLGMIFLLLYTAFTAVATLFELNHFGNFSLPTCKM